MKKVTIRRWITGILLCTLLAGLLACQPTPEEEIVINRGDGVMEEKIFGATAPSQQIEKTNQWTESLSLGTGLTLEIDCLVEWGEENVYPVNQYAPAPFTAEKIVQLSSLFFGEITGLREQEVSYEELVNKLLRLDQGMYEGLDAEGNPLWLPYSAEEKAEKEAEIRAQMAQVPVADTFAPFTADTLPLQQEGHTHLTLQRRDGTLGYGDVFLEERCWSLYLSKEDGSILSYEGTPTLTQEEAQSMAEAYLTSVGADHMGLASATKAKYGAYGEVFSEGWLFTYVPVLAGTRSVSLLGYGRHEGFRDNFTEEYASQFEPEELILYVTEKGVEYMQWSNPYTPQEVANENVALLSFEEVQDYVRNYMQLGFPQTVEGNRSDANRMLVKRVVLTSTLVHVREDLQTGYRVPVWAIFYLSDEDEKMGYPQSVLLVNALDGSLVR